MSVEGLTQTQERKISRMFALENEDAVQWFNQLQVFSDLQDSRKLAAFRKMDLNHFLRLCNDVEQAKLSRRPEIEAVNEKKEKIKQAQEYLRELGLSLADIASIQEQREVKKTTSNSKNGSRVVVSEALTDDPNSVIMRGKILEFYKAFYSLSNPDGSFNIKLQEAREAIGFDSGKFSNYQNILKQKAVYIGNLNYGTAKILALPQYLD